MNIKTIVLNTNGIISSSLLPSFIQKSVVFTKTRIFPRSRWAWPKNTFSIAESAESSVAVSRDSIEYSGSGIVNKSIIHNIENNMPPICKKLILSAKLGDYFMTCPYCYYLCAALIFHASVANTLQI